jgi:predicted HicB family RNase H-like nuclease
VRDSRTTIRLPKELHEQAKAKAKREDLSLSQVVRRLLREWLAADPPQDEQKGEQQSTNE